MSRTLQQHHRPGLGEPRRLSPGLAPSRSSARPSTPSSPGSTAASCGWPRRCGGEWLTHQWIKKAVLLSFRLEDNQVMPGACTAVLRQGADEIRRLLGRGFRAPAAFASCRPRSPGAAPTSRSNVGPDAFLREHRRLRRRGHDGRHLGHGRQLRADRQERAPLGRRRHRRRARAAAGESRPSSRTTASSARAPRSSRA